MRVLVTGSDGYIGSLLGPLLMERGHDVVGLDTGFFRNAWLYNGVRAFPPCITTDTRETTEGDLDGFDSVVHLAELSNDPMGALDPAVTYEINHKGSVALARKAKDAGVTRFVYSSSCSVYGTGSGDIKDERSETNPQTAYAKCKLLVERDVSELAGETFSPVFLRNATAYGPSPRMRFDLVLNNLSGLAWTTAEIKMISDGTPWRPLVHVLDICEAMACALEAPREAIHKQVFNVGDSDENYQIRDIAQIVADTFPGCALTVGTLGGDNRSYRVSFDKISSELPGFRCRHDASAGARQLKTLFERVDMSAELFNSNAYTRLKQLQYLIQTGQVDGALYWRQ